jgi:hypothetical protein
MLVPRVQEAVAKRVPADRLIGALQGETERLEAARRLWRETRSEEPGPADWQRTANLLAWGAPEADIRTLIRATARRRADYVAATDLFVGIVRWGLAREAALKLAAAVCDSSLASADFPVVTDTLARARGARLTPAAVAERILAALPDAKSARELQEQVLYE